MTAKTTDIGTSQRFTSARIMIVVISIGIAEKSPMTRFVT